MKARADRLFASLTAPVDVIVLMNGNGHLKDYTFKYVSGVTRGGYEGCSAILKKDARPTLVVSRLEAESAGTAPDCDVAIFASAGENKAELRRVIGEAPARIGVNASSLVLAKANLLREIYPDAELVDVSEAISAARLVKDATEIAAVRRACQLTSDVAAAIPGMLREGMTEKQLAASIAEAIQRGGGSVAFDTIVCFGANGAEPHYSPGDVALRKGDMILIDFGSAVDDYCSDITRMYLFGRASAEQRRMFDVVADAQRRAVEATRAGAAGRDIHGLAQDVIDASEFKGRFIHGLGHSIGLEVHDGPGLSPASKLTLAPGMIMTVEPGVYVPGVGGVRIEDTVLVTDNEPEILTPVTKDLVEVPA
jgi:Xaa-Pro dipeptidase